MSFYNIQEYKVIRPLTKDEIIYLVSLLIKINLPEVEIKKCISDINWHGMEAYENPVEAFNDYQEKIKRNCTFAEVEVVLNNILEYIEIIETKEDYFLWKDEIAEELKKIRNILNQDNTYELEEGKKLYRKRWKGEEINGKSNE